MANTDTQMLITELRSFVTSEFQRIYLKLLEQEFTIMATFAEFIQKQSDQTLAIADAANTLAANTTVILALVEQLKNNVNPSQAEIDNAYDVVSSQLAQIGAIKDSALQLNPIVASPTEPTTPQEPVPAPTEPIPTSPGDISIEPAPGDVGLPGTSSFSVRRK